VFAKKLWKAIAMDSYDSFSPLGKATWLEDVLMQREQIGMT
jgi:hypothetical protein